MKLTTAVMGASLEIFIIYFYVQDGAALFYLFFNPIEFMAFPIIFYFFI